MTYLVRIFRAWRLRRDIAYLELYHTALGRQPQPDEGYMRRLRHQTQALRVRLATITE